MAYGQQQVSEYGGPALKIQMDQEQKQRQELLKKQQAEAAASAAWQQKNNAERAANAKEMQDRQAARVAAVPVAEDPYSLQAIQKRQLAYADQLQNSIPTSVNSLTGAAEGQIRGQVAQAGKQSDQGYNQRGMLYSGARQAAKVGIEGQGLSQIADQRSKIASMLQNQALQAKDQAINTGLGMYDLDKQARDQQYNLDVNKSNQTVADIIAKYQKDSGLLGSLLGGAGSIAGTALGASRR